MNGPKRIYNFFQVFVSCSHVLMLDFETPGNQQHVPIAVLTTFTRQYSIHFHRWSGAVGTNSTAASLSTRPVG